jgi:hypothetical protein
MSLLQGQLRIAVLPVIASPVPATFRGPGSRRALSRQARARPLGPGLGASLLLVCLACPALAQTIPPGYHEELRLEITNAAGTVYRVSRDGGQTWREVGQVLSAATRANPTGFRASSWVPDSTVAATAVNAIHLKVAADPATGRTRLVSLVPRGPTEGDVVPQAAIVLDAGGGRSWVFDGLGPTVGSPVCLWRAEEWIPLPPDWVPAPGDKLLVLRLVPDRALRYLDFENVFGGRILATYSDGAEEVIGHVLTPVTGIGRFEGTRSADAGRLRANHAGVVDVSTSPQGMVGGFQIIPWAHANDAEMSYVRTNQQWMVVGPVNMAEGSPEGRPPLFSGTLFPSWRADDLRYEDWFNRLLSRCQVLCKRAPGGVTQAPGPGGFVPDWQGMSLEGPWELLPRIAFSREAPVDSPRPPGRRLWLLHEPAAVHLPLPPVAARCLADVVALRISLPMEVFWPEP